MGAGVKFQEASSKFESVPVGAVAYSHATRSVAEFMAAQQPTSVRGRGASGDYIIVRLLPEAPRTFEAAHEQREEGRPALDPVRRRRRPSNRLDLWALCIKAKCQRSGCKVPKDKFEVRIDLVPCRQRFGQWSIVRCSPRCILAGSGDERPQERPGTAVSPNRTSAPPPFSSKEALIR